MVHGQRLLRTSNASTGGWPYLRRRPPLRCGGCSPGWPLARRSCTWQAVYVAELRPDVLQLLPRVVRVVRGVHGEVPLVQYQVLHLAGRVRLAVAAGVLHGHGAGQLHVALHREQLKGEGLAELLQLGEHVPLVAVLAGNGARDGNPAYAARPLPPSAPAAALASASSWGRCLCALCWLAVLWWIVDAGDPTLGAWTHALRLHSFLSPRG
jgi:hypothetical protein